MSISYGEIIKGVIDSVYHTGIANKILQNMDLIRNVSDNGQARRWVMELLQNCSDTSYSDRKVNVRITLNEDKLIFQHSGKPFRVKDILSIINQVSSKDPDSNTIGRFGTGFVATFRLSEVVTISSLLHDTIEENGISRELPYRYFKVTLDRRGHSKDEILASIASSMKQLENVDDNIPENEIDPDAFNTSFVYELNNEESKRCALTGVNDLKNTIKYILLFADAIGSVEIINNITGGSVRFCRGEYSTLTASINSLSIFEERNDDTSVHRLIFTTDGELTVAASCDENKHFLPFSELTPRVFTVFPLVGSEQFPFPAIVNSLSFRPNEPRNGITLVDNIQSVDAMTNKKLMQRAVELYCDLITTTACNGYYGLENIVGIPAPHADKEISESWVNEHIYNAIFNRLYFCNMIDTDNGRTSLNDQSLHIVYGSTEEEKNNVKLLTGYFRNFTVPSGNEHWDDAFRNYGVPAEKTIDAVKLYQNTSGYLNSYYSGNADELVDWCIRLCSLSKENTSLKTMISAGTAAVFPTQNMEELNSYSLKTITEIYTDPDIPEILKDVSQKLDILRSSRGEESLNIRSELLNKKFADADIPLPAKYEVTKLFNYISNRSSRRYPVYQFSLYRETYLKAWNDAWMLMASCINDRNFYDVCNRIFYNTLPEYQRIDECYYSNRSIWNNSVVNLFLMVCEKIASLNDISGLREYLQHQDDEDTFRSLSELITSAVNNNCPLEDEEAVIFPVLDGRFVSLYRGFLYTQKYADKLESTELYDILAAFKKIDSTFNVKSYTVDRRIDAHLLNLPAMTDQIVCEKINSALITVLSGGPLSSAPEEQQQACTKLLSWIRNHPDAAKKYFPNYSSEEGQMKLLTPQSAVLMQRMVDKCDALLKKFSYADIEALETALEDLNNYDDGTFFSDELGVYAYDLFGMTPEERMEFCRKVGEAGERYVFDHLVDEIKTDGYTVRSETDGETVLIKQEDDNCKKITVRRGDHAGHKQSGWDICIIRDEHEKQTTSYYEVKTHTGNSIVRDYISISNSQMKMAMQHSNDYYVIKVKCNRSDFRCSVAGIYSNIAECIALGRLSSSDGYTFIARN